MKIKKVLSLVLVFVLMCCLCTAVAFAAPIVLPESPDAPIVQPGGQAVASYGGDNGGIVIIDPNTNKPVHTPAPVVTEYVFTTAPVLTKNPTGESIESGDSVVFVARADGASVVTWYITDGKTSYLASDIGNAFKGVVATGYNTERLVLENVPSDMNGWHAQAVFGNEYGTTSSTEAEITVAADPNATPAPTPTPLPAASPTPTPYAANNIVVSNGSGSQTATSNGASGLNTAGTTVGNSNTTAIAGGDSSNPADAAKTAGVNAVQTAGTAAAGSAGSAKNTHVGAYILAGLAGLVIIACVLLMALYMKGKVSLGKFEKFLGSFGNEESDAGKDAEFYNPDDFKDT